MSWQHALLGGCLAFAAWCAVLVLLREKDTRRKPNIRVPRETLWSRTNRYHEASRGR